MKLLSLFVEFLNDTVNLNDSRLTDLENSVAAIMKYIRASQWEPRLVGFAGQGSWTHKTIIKPVDKGEFDADLLVFVHHVEGWTAAEYINTLYDAFRDSGIYADKVRRWSHCVTVTYANDKHIDIAPCVTDRLGFERFEVCNRDLDDFQCSEPKQFTNWLVEKNSYSGANSFRKVTRLLKYVRDIKTRFTCSSVLLTTLLAMQINSRDVGDAGFADTPTALKTIVGRLDDWLYARPDKPVVANPFLSTEDFATAWTDDQYKNFRTFISKYRGWIDTAFNESDRDASITAWRRIFGDEFAKAVTVKKSSAFGGIAEALNAGTAYAVDLVAQVMQFGAGAIPAAFDRQPHMQPPAWRRESLTIPRVTVSAGLYDRKYGGEIRSLVSGDILPKNRAIRFSAQGPDGHTLSSNDFEVRWRVTNTGDEAAQEKSLRGGFERSEATGERWETLRYRGVHLVEAFVLRRNSEVLVGTSAPFRVVIA